ncbi:porin [Alteromonas halophila]|uniref:Porin n=1 Tax=Alteromonas halophila TaxID=516698 RepID=A0A918N0B7_9ALTE|nr:porin [Alteromonas halophila]GGW92939.1 hypothetical protein GCM10007391_28990 [Alteromonas halophila]
MPVTASYDKPGITFQTEDQRYKVNVHARFQFRYATPDDTQPLIRDDYAQEQGTEFGVNRSRLKIKGHAYKRWLRFSMEYDLKNNYLLDYRFRMEKYDALKVKLGQWKLEYSRERSISSGGQQMLDRSIINRHFTIDRHQAVSVYGHIQSGETLDFNYWAGIGTGTGRGSNQDDDSQPLYFGRLQWNALGGGVGFVASDLSVSSQPRLSFAYAAATNRSRYTRFSSSGGGSLTGFDTGQPGQFEITQFNIDGAFQYAGLSAQAEYHEKTITDRRNNNLETDLKGYYVQVGYFFHQLVDAWPKHLELAGRYASYEPESVTDKTQTEYAVAANYFIQGHKNKVTVDATYFEQSQALLTDVDEWRYRIQWDVSF